MSFFKDSTGNLHWLDDDAYTHMLPEGSIKITDEEAIAMQGAATETYTFERLNTELVDYFDDVARAKGYDNRLTCAMRAGYPNPWQEECITFGEWMDACYQALFIVEQDVSTGTRDIPSASALISELPAPPWEV